MIENRVVYEVGYLALVPSTRGCLPGGIGLEHAQDSGALRVPGIHPAKLVGLGDGIDYRSITEELAGGAIADHAANRYLALVGLASGLRENTENAPGVVGDDSADL